MQDQNFERGMKIRRAVLGDDHVDRATAATTEFNRDFQEMITSYCWGGIWGRPGLDRRTRSLITLALLVALGREEEFRLHVNASLNTGCTPDDLKEILLQAAIYCGVPAANSAFRIAKETYEEAGVVA